ncbi:hypothetical protein ACFWP7_28770 [Streptomyces sp. NPDC058470]|uniref:hypothetical protein n=1 Tax=Streptomyces sp. NPDC058470 TaxID=3346515 RepID=UPI00364F92EF
MAGPERPQPPRLEPHEHRRRAEDSLGLGDVDVPRAIAWALLAVAGELALIRKQLSRR